jgi:PKD repeat protein
VKGKKEDKALIELFRHKLGNAELIPSSYVSKKLMRKLARREFLRFNPTRLNVWYTGGITIVGAALILLFTSGPGEKSESEIREKPVAIKKPEINRNSTDNTVSLTEGNKAENTGISGTGTNKSAERTAEAIEADRKVVSKKAMKTVNVVTPAEVSSIPDINIFRNEISEKNKLQEKARQVDNLIGASVTEGCTPIKVTFKNMSLTTDSCKWTFGDGGHSYESNPEWIFDVEGEYEVILQVFGQDGRQSYSSVIIRVHPAPVARFEITPEDAIIPNDEVTFINYSTNAEEYFWDFGDGTTSKLFEPKHSYSTYSNYNVRLIAFSAYGCSDSIMVRNAFGSGYYIKFPNAFIPNPNGPSGGYYSNRSDEDAYVFHPVHSGVSEYQLRIFSRRGILVFETNDVNIGWDGYYKGQPVDPGVYIWKVRGDYINGEPFTLMGDVTLLKNQ